MRIFDTPLYRFVMLFAAILTSPALVEYVVAQESPANSATGFFDVGKLNPAIPAPEAVIDLPVGLNTVRHSPLDAYSRQIRQKAVSYDALSGYMQKLAAVSDRIKITPCGKSHEGRTLFFLTVTSSANHKRLGKIKALNARLADPRKLTDKDDVNKIIAELPAVAWMSYSIHGDELSSTDAAMYIVYRLAAATDKNTIRLLDEVVIHLVPLVNPDGRERYLGQLHELSGIVENSDYQAMQHSGLWSQGRGNHYLFDLNRDWLVFAHPETGALAKVIDSWNPHLLVDSHEMGGLDTYLFDPPTDPVNSHLSPKNIPWRTRFGADQAAAFNRYGWSYYTGEWYTDWGPFYTSTWANLRGAVGILYEQAGANGADVKQRTGHTRTYRQTVHHQIVSSFANLETLRKNRKEILHDFHQDRIWAISADEDSFEAFILPPCKDESRRGRLISVLMQQGIEVGYAGEKFKAHGLVDIWGQEHESMEFGPGAAVIKSAQPQRRLLYALLEFDPRFTDESLKYERQQIEKHRGSHLYDVSSSNLAMAFALEAHWAKDIPEVKLLPHYPCKNHLPDGLKKSDYGYIIELADSKAYPALSALLQNGCNPRIATKPFQLGRKFDVGTILLRQHENPANLLAILKKVCEDHCVEIIPVDTALVQSGPDLGGNRMQLLREPRIAIASQWPVSSTSFGSVWHLLDHGIHLRTSPVNIQYLGRIDLRKYNVLILPNSRSLSAVLGESAVKQIKRWVEAGGTLIAIGNSAAFAAGKERQLSSVRLRRDVLEELGVYAEALARETNARNVKIDASVVWGKGPDKAKADSSEEGKDTPAKKDADALKRIDQWQRMFSPTGVFVATDIDPEHWLTFGCDRKMPVMYYGSQSLMAKHPIAAPVRLADKENLRLSGLLWPEPKERLAGAAYATVERLGHGQIILFACDPTYRAWLAGSQRLFLNAVILGPGMGTSPPVPW